MDLERESRILEGAIRKFGKKHQSIKAIEELAELVQAIVKYLDSGSVADYDAVMYEIADASIMLNQLEMIYGDVTPYEVEKLERLERLVQDDG